jgi:hypothetical protein
MITIATDLDRTLFPNGKQDYDNSMPVFKRIIEDHRITLIYVTGRNQQQIEEGIHKYDPPLPEYAVAEVGTKIHRFHEGAFHIDDGYRNFIERNTRNWDRENIQQLVEELPWLSIQEAHNQNEFKVSFYADNPQDLTDRIEEVEEKVKIVTPDAALTTSVDETRNIGLLDIMPFRANKMEGIEYLRRRLSIPKDQVIYCGDSGNDLVPLTAGYQAVLVGNATEEVRERMSELARVKKVDNKIYTAGGMDGYNGNFVSGIIEGLLHFGLITPEEITR